MEGKPCAELTHCPDHGFVQGNAVSVVESMDEIFKKGLSQILDVDYFPCIAEIGEFVEALRDFIGGSCGKRADFFAGKAALDQSPWRRVLL